MGLPLANGAAKLAIILPFEMLVVGAAGALGTEAMVTEFEGAESGPTPAALDAFTTKL
jgi:hypothetical protein